ncbi:unnamed protein product [[Candida] boidinii]|nr:unnamed protein product [[Candida] boidinii]
MSQKCPSVNIFIERSLNLFEASPNTTKIVIRYSLTNLKKLKKLKLKNEKNEEFKNLSKDYKNFDKLSKNYVIFKTIDSITGTIIKYKTNKSKDVSRLITFAGPLGVQSTKTKLIKKNEDKINSNDDDKSKDIEMEDVSENNNNKSKISYTVNIRGLSSVMTNKKFESKIVENTPEPETSTVAAVAASTGDNSVSKESTPQSQSQQAPSSSKSKKNKKKGKKR